MFVCFNLSVCSFLCKSCSVSECLVVSFLILLHVVATETRYCCGHIVKHSQPQALSGLGILILGRLTADIVQRVLQFSAGSGIATKGRHHYSQKSQDVCLNPWKKETRKEKSLLLLFHPKYPSESWAPTWWQLLSSFYNMLSFVSYVRYTSLPLLHTLYLHRCLHIRYFYITLSRFCFRFWPGLHTSPPII